MNTEKVPGARLATWNVNFVILEITNSNSIEKIRQFLDISEDKTHSELNKRLNCLN